jgi:hypothetical protein
VRVIRIDDERAGPKAILVHYSCEAAVLGPGNQEVSADFPGAMSRDMEGEFGRGVVCFFLAGASANIYPSSLGFTVPKAFQKWTGWVSDWAAKPCAWVVT